MQVPKRAFICTQARFYFRENKRGGNRCSGVGGESLLLLAFSPLLLRFGPLSCHRMGERERGGLQKNGPVKIRGKRGGRGRRGEREEEEGPWLLLRAS